MLSDMPHGQLKKGKQIESTTVNMEKLEFTEPLIHLLLRLESIIVFMRFLK